MKITQEEFDTKTLGGKMLAFNVVRSNIYLFMFKTYSLVRIMFTVLFVIGSNWVKPTQPI